MCPHRFPRPTIVLEPRDAPAVLLNEIFVNPPGTDDNREFIEIRDTSGAASLAGLWLLEIDGDGAAAGVIDHALNLSALATGVSGLLLIGDKYSAGHPWGALVDPATPLADLNRPASPAIENGNITVLLVSNFTGAVGHDLDATNDGVLDAMPWDGVIDAVGWVDPAAAGKVYSTASLKQAGNGTPDAATRFVGDTNPAYAGGWYAGDIQAVGGLPDLGRDYVPSKASANLPVGAKLTPGDLNFGPAAGPPAIISIRVNDGSAQRSMVTSLEVTFSEAVTFPAGITSAFRLNRLGPGAPQGLVNLDAVQTGSMVTLSFQSGVVPVGVGGTLIDGVYELTAVAGKIQGVGGLLDGNGDGVGGDSFTTPTAPGAPGRLFRLFGDADGDADVDAADFGAFRFAFGGYDIAFDSDGDGDVDAVDFAAVRQRFGTAL